MGGIELLCHSANWHLVAEFSFEDLLMVFVELGICLPVSYFFEFLLMVVVAAFYTFFEDGVDDNWPAIVEVFLHNKKYNNVVFSCQWSILWERTNDSMDGYKWFISWVI